MRKYLYFTIFTSGMASLAIEMAASRLLSNVYGTSNLVWAGIIGLILIYLAVGNFIGGRWADRSPHKKTFFAILVYAGLTTAIVPVIAQPVLRTAANAFDQLQIGILVGAFVSVMILMVVPIILLGMASPFGIRIIADEEGIGASQLGKISGKVYAISTIGSFIGTFLPGLIMIPTIGTYQTFVVLGGLLTLISLIGILRSDGWRKALPLGWTFLMILIISFFGIQRTIKNSQYMIYEGESAYNYIQVLEIGDARYLRLNEGQGQHSVYHPDEYYFSGPWSQVLVAPFFNHAPVAPADIQRIAIVGLAAGTTARQASVVYPQAIVDGWEIDPKIIEIGKQYFGMDLPNLNAYAQDGRWGLEHSPYLYDIISVDAYRPPYIPPHLTTVEFFGIAHERLTDNGVLVINVGRTNTDRRLVDALATTISVHFPSVHVMDLPSAFNTIIFATKQPTAQENFAENMALLWEDPDTAMMLKYAMLNTQSNFAPQPQTTIVFTDDKAGIEWMTNNLMIQFALNEGLGTLE
jgi:spermidine synthase